MSSLAAAAQADPFLTVREVIEQTGIDKSTVYYLIAKGEISHYRHPSRTGSPSGPIRVRQSDLDAYLASVRVETAP